MEFHDNDMLMEDSAAVRQFQFCAGLNDLTTMTGRDNMRVPTLVGDRIDAPNHDSVQNSTVSLQDQVEEDPSTIWNKQEQKLRRCIFAVRTILTSNKTSAEKETILRRHITSVKKRLRRLGREEAQLAQQSLPPQENKHTFSSPVAVYQPVRDSDRQQWLIPIKRVCLERKLARLQLWNIRIQYQDNLHHPEVFKAVRDMDHALHHFQEAHDQVLQRRDMRPKPDPRHYAIVKVMSGLRGLTSLPESVESEFAKDVEGKYCYRSESHDNTFTEQDENMCKRRCPVLDVEPCPMQSVPIFPLKAAQEGMLGVFGTMLFPELVTAYNGLWLSTLIAGMFARFEVTIVPYDHRYLDSYYRIHFVNVSDQTLAQLTHSGRPGERIADLDGKKLEFSTDFRPKMEFLYFHHVCALISLWTRNDRQEGREHYLNQIEATSSKSQNNEIYSSGDEDFGLIDTESRYSIDEKLDAFWDKTRPSNRNLAYLRSIWKVEGTFLRRHLMQKLAIQYGNALPDDHRNHCKHVVEDYVSEDEEMVLDLLVEDAIRISLKDDLHPLRTPSVLEETGEEIEEIIYESAYEVEEIISDGEESLERNQNNIEMEDTRETLEHDIHSEIDEPKTNLEVFEDYDDEGDLDYRE